MVSDLLFELSLPAPGDMSTHGAALPACRQLGISGLTVWDLHLQSASRACPFMLHLPARARLQIAGHVISEDGKKKVALKGKWNSFLDMTRCNEEGEPLAGAETVRLWEVSAFRGGVLQPCSSGSVVKPHRQEGQAPNRGTKTGCAWLLKPPVRAGEWPGKGRRCVHVQEADCHLSNLEKIKAA